MQESRRTRRTAGPAAVLTRKRIPMHFLRAVILVSLIIISIVLFFTVETRELEKLLASSSTQSNNNNNNNDNNNNNNNNIINNYIPSSFLSSQTSVNPFFTRVSFVMSESMAEGWLKSSQRLAFDAELWVDRVKYENTENINNKSVNVSKHIPEERRIISEKELGRQKAEVSAVLYGKSSLKLMYTTRRSLHIRSKHSFTFMTPSEVVEPAGNQETNKLIELKEFLLLSLWEDTERITYRASVDLLQQLDLLYSYAQLIEVRCFPPLGKVSYNHPCKPSSSSSSYNIVQDGEYNGRTLGVYLLLEPPAPAIWRRMKASFEAFNYVKFARDNDDDDDDDDNDDNDDDNDDDDDDDYYYDEEEKEEKRLNKLLQQQSEQNAEHDDDNNNNNNNNNDNNDNDIENDDDITDLFFPPEIRRREYETVTEHDIRLQYLQRVSRVVQESYDNNIEAAIEIASRNYISERGPVHDLSHVPSYKKNSSFLPSYRKLEKDPKHYGFFDPMALIGEKRSRGGKRNEEMNDFFDLSQYMAWLAVNYLLKNSDYDDEALFYGVIDPNDNNNKLLSSSNKEIPIPLYLGFMAWDYDSIFRRCHRKAWFETSITFCSETILDYNILTTPALQKRYLEILRNLVHQVDVKRFNRSLFVAQNEINTVLRGAPGAFQATFDKVSGGANSQRVLKMFKEQWETVLLSLALYFPEDTLIKSYLADKPNHQKDNFVPSSYTRETHIELLKHLSKSITVKGSTIKTDLGLEIQVVQSARGRDVPQTTGYILPSPGIYCARVAVPISLLHTDALNSIANELREEKRSTLLVNIPLILSHKGKRRTAEYGLWPVIKPNPMNSKMIIPEDNTKLQIIIPPVWPRKTEEISGVFIARILQPRNDNDNLSFSWTRKNVKLSNAEFESLNTMIIRGYSAIRFKVIKGGHDIYNDKKDENTLSSLIDLHKKENEIQGPLLYISNDLTELIVPNATIRQKASLSSISSPPSPPSWVSFLDKNNFVDSTGSRFGKIITEGETLICKPANSANTFTASNPSVRVATCPIFVHDTFEIQSGGKLEVLAGCVFVLSPQTYIHSFGTIEFKGSADSPIVITGESPKSSTSGSNSDYNNWRTIHMEGKKASLYANYTFFTGSGLKGIRVSKTGGHHSHSAAISATDEAFVLLQNSFIIEVLGAAIAAGKNAIVRVEDSIIQWAQMGVECHHCNFTSLRSLWSNFPSWDSFYIDNDNDALYLSGGEHRVIDSVIAHTKDDGIDSGGSGESGSIVIHNTIIENCMHEGIALSTEPKSSREAVIAHTFIQNCQQGIESGYTAEGHKASITSSLIKNCAIGVRYGDNYPWFYAGVMMLHNITLANNEINSMNYVRKNAAPIGIENFKVINEIPQNHWKLVKEASQQSALVLFGETRKGNTRLFHDIRSSLMTEATDWKDCSGVFSIPGESQSLVEKSELSSELVMEENYIVNITGFL